MHTYKKAAAALTAAAISFSIFAACGKTDVPREVSETESTEPIKSKFNQNELGKLATISKTIH